MSRTINSFKNIFVGVIGQIAQVILQFVCRSVFIIALSKEYLGVGGLFSNILSVLSLAELGFGTALIYSLYKPIHDNDEILIVKLINLYKKIYKIVALFVFVAGISLLPFLQYFIKDYDSYRQLTTLPLIYFLFLINTVASYMYIYKKSLIDAYQKNYIYLVIQKGMIMLQNILQMLYILLTHDFIGYLVIQVFITILTNLIVSHKADKMFPYLVNCTSELPDVDVRKEIYKNTAAMSMHKLGAVVVNGTDNLILSSTVSLLSVALYSNYFLIISNLNAFVELIFKSVTASIGDLGTTKDDKRLLDVFYMLNFIQFWVYSFASACLFSLLNPFIELWIGSEFLFDIPIVSTLVLVFYLKGMRVVINIYRDSLGLFWYDRYKPILEAIVNLVASIVLAKVFGIVGVFIGTALSTILVCLWVEPYILYRYAFKVSVRNYFFRYFGYAVFSIALCAFSYLISFIAPKGILGIFLILLATGIVFHASLIVFYFKNPDFRSTLKFVKSVALKIKYG